jgi:NAD(P)-dependent dehydrogenase (short-subunit alcohol dehydrogenase family)
MRLQGKAALLTGAAAAIKGELMGFGGAAAHLFVREGARVVLPDIRDELGGRAAASLRGEGHDARYLHLDVTSEQNWAQVMAAHGRLDILFNNAGVSFPAKVEDTTVASGIASLACMPTDSHRSSRLTSSESSMKSALSIRSGQQGDTNKGTEPLCVICGPLRYSRQILASIQQARKSSRK